MRSSRPSLRLCVAVVALTVPAGASAQTSSVPTSGSDSGYSWTTFPLGPTDAPSAAAAAFGLVWLPDAGTGSGQLTAVDPATGAVAGQYSPAGAPRVSGALAQGNYLWLAGPRNAGVRVIAVDQTGTTRLTFNGPVKSAWASGGGDAFGGANLAYGAGAIWVSDQVANRVYAISPTTGRLVRTIKVTAPRSVAVSGRTVWVTNVQTNRASIFSAMTSKRLAVVSTSAAPSVMASSNGTMWVFGEEAVTGFSTSTLKRTAWVSIPGPGNSWAGVATLSGSFWVSNNVASVVGFNPVTRSVIASAGWSNHDLGGGIASANGSLWVANQDVYAFPLGFGVTRITPTPSPAT